MRAGFTPIYIKGFQGRERSCGPRNSSEGSQMIKANLYIVRQLYKSTVWNSHFLIDFPSSRLWTVHIYNVGPLKANRNEILTTITLVLISR